MSYDDYHEDWHDDIIITTAKEVRKLLEKQTQMTLLCVIEQNLQGPKPHHKNAELMETVLLMEANDGRGH